MKTKRKVNAPPGIRTRVPRCKPIWEWEARILTTELTALFLFDFVEEAGLNLISYSKDGCLGVVMISQAQTGRCVGRYGNGFGTDTGRIGRRTMQLLDKFMGLYEHLA